RAARHRASPAAAPGPRPSRGRRRRPGAARNEPPRERHRLAAGRCGADVAGLRREPPAGAAHARISRRPRDPGRAGCRADRLLRAGHPPPRHVAARVVPADGQRHHRRRLSDHGAHQPDHGARHLPRRAVRRRGPASAHQPGAGHLRPCRPRRTAGAARLMKTDALLIAPVAMPLLGAVCFLFATLRPRLGWPLSAWVSPACAAVALGAAIELAVVRSGRGPVTALGGLVRADSLSEFMLIVIGAVGLLATAASPAWLNAEIAAQRASARAAVKHSALVQLFLAAMAAAVLAASLGLVWVAIEGTTVVTAFLVGQRKTRQAVEAAWKYVMICSTGIALALLGLLVLNAAAAHAGVPAGLDWTRLVAAAPHLDRGVTRIAVALLLIGFGTKAGLAPLHAWLPDAHGQAPAPVSALMSGVLLSVAFYAILRVKVIADLALGTSYTRTLLVILALASLLLAASLLIRQRDYK